MLMALGDATITSDEGQACQREDIGHFYSEHHRWLHGWLCKKLGCTHHAADVAQNTFMRLFSLSSLAKINEPRGFLTTTATRLMIDESRRKKVQQRYIELQAHSAEEAVAPSSEELTLIAEKLATVILMLEGLPEKCQKAFLMSKFDGMRYSDIAKELGVSTAMVQQYMTKVTLAYYKLIYEFDAE